MKRATEIAIAMEVADKDTSELHQTAKPDGIHRMQQQKQKSPGKPSKGSAPAEKSSTSTMSSGPCPSCNKTHKGTCRFKNARCYKCNKQGHISSACGKTNVKTVYELYSISKTVNPIKCTMSIENVCVPMELDTGASVSLMGQTNFDKLLNSVTVEKSTDTL